jgi:cytochrome c oxidase assembly factor CtaG
MLTIAIILIGCVCLRGWLSIRKTRAEQFAPLRLSCFLLGLAVLWIAVSSPLDGFADVLLSAHMLQHLLLMSVVPPLLLLGWPVAPRLRGPPAWILRPVLAPLLRLAVLRRLGRWLISPPVAWLAMNLTFLGCMCPRPTILRSHTGIGTISNTSVFSPAHLHFGGVWSALGQPSSAGTSGDWCCTFFRPTWSTPRSPRSFAFCDWPVYRYYLAQPNPFHVSPLSDQVLGAVVMWVVGSFVFLVPAAWITFTLLHAPSTRVA